MILTGAKLTIVVPAHARCEPFLQAAAQGTLQGLPGYRLIGRDLAGVMWNFGLKTSLDVRWSLGLVRLCDTAILAVSFERSTSKRAGATNQIASLLVAPGTTRSKSFRLSNSLSSTVSESPTCAQDREKRVPAVTVFFGVLRSRQTRENTGSKIHWKLRETAGTMSF